MSGIDYSRNVLSFEDLKNRVEYLEKVFAGGEPDPDSSDLVWDQWDELQIIKDLVDELHWCDSSAVLVSDSYWVQYCQETCYDLGFVSKGSIVDTYTDWDKVADSFMQDWKLYNLPDGNDFYVRS